MVKKSYRKGDKVILINPRGGSAVNGDLGVVSKGGTAALRVDFASQDDYGCAVTDVLSYTPTNLGDRVRCIHTGVKTTEGRTGGAGWELHKEFVVARITNDFPSRVLWDASNDSGIYESWVTNLSDTKENGKLPLIDQAPEVEPFDTKALGKHDILGQDVITRQLELAAKKDIAALIVGDTGSGKTTIVKSIADKKKQPYTRFNLTGETTVDEFVGKYVLRNKETVWEDGVLLTAMKKGHWLIVDEINVALPEILFVLHSLLDDDRSVLVANHNGEIIHPASNFRFFGTMNPVDEYAGTKDLNKAFKSRFGMILNMDYPDTKIEAQIVAGKGEVDAETAMKIVDVGRLVRKSKADNESFYTCSTRDLIQWAMLVGDLEIHEAFEVSVLNKANGDRDVVQKAYDTIFEAYQKAEKDGHELNLDQLVKTSLEVKEALEYVKMSKEKVRKQVKGELLKQLVEKSEDDEMKTLVKELL